MTTLITSLWDEFVIYNTNAQINFQIPVEVLNIGREGFEYYRMLALQHVQPNTAVHHVLDIMKNRVVVTKQQQGRRIIFDNVKNTNYAVVICFWIYIAANEYSHWEIHLLDEMVLFCTNQTENYFNFNTFHVLWNADSVQKVLRQTCHIAKTAFMYKK